VAGAVRAHSSLEDASGSVQRLAILYYAPTLKARVLTIPR
jgi:hypothetical protein